MRTAVRFPVLTSLLAALLLALSVELAAAQTVFPGQSWDVAQPETQSLSAEGIEKVAAWHKANGSKAGLVVRHGRIVGEWYQGGADADTQLQVYSTTKSFAGTAAALAIAAGQLKLGTKLGELFPAASPDEKRAITVRQLLSMTSGAKSENSELRRPDLFHWALDEMPMAFPPGEKWEYNNSGLALLSPVIHQATGRNIDELLADEVFAKIGIAPDTWTWNHRDGMPTPYSGLRITARSLARFGLLFLNKGAWKKKPLVSSTWVTEATAPSQDLKPEYGYLWWNNRNDSWPDVPTDAFAALGLYGNVMLVVPSLDLIVVRLVGDDSAEKRRVDIAELFTLACAAVKDKSPSLAVADTPIDVEVERTFTNLRIDRPILITHAGDGTNRLFIPSQKGKIWVMPNDPAVEEPELFLDLESRVVYVDRENEKGFLGMAFHPNYRENGEFFVYYTPVDTPQPHTVVVSRFKVSKDDPNKADPDSEERLLAVEHPFWNHKGGTIVFGPDGYLYIAIGDGGFRNDPHKNGQNLKSLLAKILRIDVDHQDPGKKYAIPKDNPFVDGPDGARGEIWAYGLRNPWRIAFDPKTGTLWCADVGQDLWEEIDLIEKGGNYGWNLREGVHKFGQHGSEKSPELIEPIWDYHHDVGKSITGGHVYRGKKLPQLEGCYLYADYVSGKLWALKYDEENNEIIANYVISGNVSPIMSFGEDEQGESYYTTDGGLIYGFRTKAN